MSYFPVKCIYWLELPQWSSCVLLSSWKSSTSSKWPLTQIWMTFKVWFILRKIAYNLKSCEIYYVCTFSAHWWVRHRMDIPREEQVRRVSNPKPLFYLSPDAPVCGCHILNTHGQNLNLSAVFGVDHPTVLIIGIMFVVSQIDLSIGDSAGFHGNHLSRVHSSPAFVAVFVWVPQFFFVFPSYISNSHNFTGHWNTTLQYAEQPWIIQHRQVKVGCIESL